MNENVYWFNRQIDNLIWPECQLRAKFLYHDDFRLYSSNKLFDWNRVDYNWQ